MILKWPFFVILTLLLPVFAFAQSEIDPEQWKYIESAIRSKKHLVDIYDRLNNIKTTAQQQKDYNIYARARFCQLLIIDQKSEDSLYLQNATFIDSTLLDPRSPAALRLPMHLMLAQRLRAFKEKINYRNHGYFKGDIYKYASFTGPMLDSAIQFQYEQAKILANGFDETTPDRYLWLSSNPLVFLFKPGLKDIVLAEQIAYNTSVSYLSEFWRKQFSQWLLLSPADFIKALDTVNSNERSMVVLRLYRDWLALHKKDPAAFFYLETLIRKYIYERHRYLKNDDELIYEKYLQAQSESSIKEVRAHCIYQLCLLWNSRTKYNYRSKDKWPPAKALRLYESNRALFADYFYLGQILEEMKKKIMASEINWKMDHVSLPGEPILVQIEYRNVRNLYYRIIPVLQHERTFYPGDSTIKYLPGRPFIRSVNDTLPFVDDMDVHSVLLKIDALPVGRYNILFSAKEITTYEKGISSIEFEVSQISIITSGDRVYVLNRRSGHALQGARVEVSYDESDKITNRVIGKEGYINIKRKEDYDVDVTFGKDTADDYDESASELSNDLWDKESDELLDYYTDNTRIHILTDRSIYRPGQTVYYKGIVMTKDPYRGEDIIVNKKHLQHGPFRNYFKKWLSGEEPEFYITDPFNRKVDTIKIKPNEYGSVSGSYRLPATAATGTWEFDGDFEGSGRTGSFSVEEYKRPAFEFTEERQARAYMPGDTLTFKLKVRAFSGATMANTKITYNIRRTNLNNIEEGAFEKLDYDSVIYTNENGIVNIVVSDNAIRYASLPDSIKYSINYKLSATAVDLAGESHTLNTALTVTNRPVIIKMPFKENYFVGDFKPLLITANDLNKVELKKEIRVKVYRKKESHLNPLPSFTLLPDQWKYPKEQWAAWFPQYKFDRVQWEEPELVYETTIKTGWGEKLRFPANVLSAGVYTVEAACYDNEIVRGETKNEFTIYDTVSHHIPGGEASCLHVPDKSFNAGDTVIVYAGSGFDSTLIYLQLKYYSRANKKLQILSVYRQETVNAGVHLFKFRIPVDATDRASISSFFIRNNEVYKHSEQLFVNRPSAYPSIIIEQFRNKLTPGQQTTFSVSVKTNDNKVAAELMSTLYDASLDRLKKHTWEAPYLGSLESPDKDWPGTFNGIRSGNIYNSEYNVQSPGNRSSLWWMPNALYLPDLLRLPDLEADVMGDWNSIPGRVGGLNISMTKGLEDVVVVGYGTRKLTSSLASVKTYRSDITLRGLNSLVGDNKPLVLLDGVPVNADMSGVNVAEITEVMVLKDADATAIYGARAANGVIIISTKGPIQLPEVKQEPVVKVRSNFNELAFFYPAVYADRDGYYRFTFTVPESLTEWNWKLFAHTKNAKFAYAERKLTTQLPFMIQPNMPRQLYQGDRLILKTRISNLDSLHRAGKTICKVEDAVTGEDMTGVIVKNKETNFEVAAQSNTATAFILNIPVNQLNPIKVVIKAIAGEYSDGEEHLIPVMTGKVLVKQAVPFSLTNHADTLISIPVLNDVYGVGVNIQPKPQGALINSLPFLANYSFDCAEQTFNKMLANVTALGIMRTDKAMQQLHTTINNAVEKAITPHLMPGLISEQAMPWLHLTTRSALQQKQLAALLDSGRAKDAIYDHFEKLRSLQNKDGGLSWFEGGNSDKYITAYVVAGLGKIYSNPANASLINDRTNSEFIYKLIQYLDDRAGYKEIFSAYARGYWKTVYPVADSQLVQLEQTIKQQWERVATAGLHQQALLIITTMQWFGAPSDSYKKALQQLEHIRQRAIEDPVNGIRWKELADENDMSISTEETLALLTEAFNKAGNGTIINEGIAQWLLSSKTDHQWRSTKAAAAAIDILQKTQGSATGVTDKINTSINGKNITVTNNLLSGESFAFVPTSKAPQTIIIKKEGNTMVHGSIVAWHFQPASQLNQLNKDIQLSKKLFIYNNASKSWEPIGDAQVLKIADIVKVVLAIETSVNLPYVYIDDKSGGAFDAVDQRSGYQYGNNISYYRSVRDAGMQIFASLIPAGKTEISYELKVTQEGSFTNGPASLQCMYKPEKAAYSNSALINTSE
jgi:TonB-dependent SusC/RagA subfamily outer membrane receptor